MEPGKTLGDFWPYYLQEHQNMNNILLHATGTTIALGLFVASFLSTYWLLLAALVAGYGFAWAGHLLIEKNKPATFQYPIRSFLSDWKLWWYTVTLRIPKEMQKHGHWK